ncbi:MAG: hypothetical protein RIS29_1366 [Bacteroidota bacterium]|jgi:hypothetical protein
MVDDRKNSNADETDLADINGFYSDDVFFENRG